MTHMQIRDASLYVKIIGQGPPLLLMHGGPGADHSTLSSLEALAESFTLVFYDHRCNGRSEGAEVTSMTWENLTADAEGLRQALGYEKWAVLGHSFGGMVALEYALRYPQSISQLILMDTCGEANWARQKAAELLARQGYRPGEVQAARRFFQGEARPEEFIRLMMKFGKAYYYRPNFLTLIHSLFSGGMQVRMRPEAQIYAFSKLLPGWTVMDRLGEIKTPALVLAGRDDFQFPPEHQAIMADRLPNARLEIIERAGHNAHTERPAEVTQAIQDFMTKRNGG